MTTRPRSMRTAKSHSSGWSGATHPPPTQLRGGDFSTQTEPRGDAEHKGYAPRPSNASGHIPIAQEYRAPGVATYNVPAVARDAEVNEFIVGVRAQCAVPAVPEDALTAKPIVIRNSIGVDAIGVKIDPVALFSGKLRVLLRDANHHQVAAGDQPGQMNPANDRRAQKMQTCIVATLIWV